MRVIPAIAANVVLLSAALGFGGTLRALLPHNFKKIDRIATVLTGGLGLLGILLFCVGQFWYTRRGIGGVLAIGLLLFAWFSRGWIREFSVCVGELRASVLPVLIVVSVLMWTAIAGLAEPIGDMNGDGVAYHFLGPKVWLREGVIRPVPDEVLTSFPAAVEAEYGALMLMGRQRAPEFFSLIALAALLLVTASLAMRLGLDVPGAWWAVAVVVTMNAAYIGAIWGFIDALAAAYVLVAVRIALDAKGIREFILAGIFCGIAMETKYTAIVSFMLLVFVMVLTEWQSEQNKKTIVKRLAILCAIAAFVASPIYLRNWIVLGCPIYPPPPSLARVFHIEGNTLIVVQNIVAGVTTTGRGMGHDFKNFLLLPWHLTYHTANFRGAGGIGLIPLALGPIGVIVSRRAALARWLAVFAILQTTTWFVTAQESRYLIPVYAIAGVFGVLGWNHVRRVSPRYGVALAGTVVACSVLYGFVMIVPSRLEDVRSALSRTFESDRRKREIPFVESFDYLNGESSVRKVLILDPNVAGFYLDKPYLKPVGRWGEESLPNATHQEEILAQVASLKVSHVLDVRYAPGKFAVVSAPKNLVLVFERNDQRVYRVWPELPQVE
jgi:hypothetical protein